MTSEDAATSAKTFGERWNEMYQRLVRFKEVHGHCLVPNRYPEDKKLGAWVSAQRRHYKILTSGKKESTPMTLERAQKLIDLGFDWSTTDPRHVSWDDRFEQLRQFKIKYGHVQVPMGWSENSSLSNWVSAQRQDYKLYNKGRPSRLTQDKIDRLNELGFVWEAQRGGRRRKLEPLSEMKEAPLSPESKADPPGDMPGRQTLHAASDALRAAGMRRPQGIPSAMMGVAGQAARFENPLSQQTLQGMFRGAGVGNQLLESQQLLNPLQNRQFLSQLGNQGVPNAMAQLQAGGFLGPSPLNAQADVLLRLQQQEQRDRAALAATLAARENFMGVNSGAFNFGAPAPTPTPAVMLGLQGTRAAMLPSAFAPTEQARRFTSASSSGSSRDRKRSNMAGIGDLFDPSLLDAPNVEDHDQEQSAKRFRTEF